MIIKDPIYGYIELDSDIVHGVVDTATFQRLRNIRQTSYGPLYPAAVHNRFSHSLGVYYLGTIAAESLKQSYERLLEESPDYWSTLKDKLDRYQQLFELACLLHDVGHSPFSHTGEKFYKGSKSGVEIKADWSQYDLRIPAEGEGKNEAEDQEAKSYTVFKHLAQLTEDLVFVSAAAQAPAAHEIMSCIVALEAFGDRFSNSDERSFFARCITGLQYEKALSKNPEDYIKGNLNTINDIKDKALRNCFIQLLHSSVIDVDRLDYIIRDAATIGYQSVSVDYTRLLKGVVLVREDNYSAVFHVGFHKSAISIIENAVYAHDIEKKWVQGHPAILYDSFLLDRSIEFIEEEIRKKYPDAKSSLFSFDSLTDTGSQFGDSMKVRYLGDADLIHLMKNVFQNSYSEEYFKRNTRRVSVWKSEAEYRGLFNADERKMISRAMRWILLIFESISYAEMNDDKLTKLVEMASDQPENPIYAKIRDLVAAVLDLCDKYEIQRNVLILSASTFTSNFHKDKVKELQIVFPGTDSRRLKEVSTTLSSDGPEDEKLYYFFYYPKRGREKVEVSGFTSELIAIFRTYTPT